MQDSRLFQIFSLLGILVFGVVFLDFPVSPLAAVVVISCALLVQVIGIWRFKLSRKTCLSALITGLGVLLLCRASSLFDWGLTAGLAVASKFLIRWKGKHFFNPANFGIIVAMWLTGAVWISPGQWGSGVVLAFFLVSLGGSVVLRVGRFDITGVFLLTHCLLLLGRTLYLGQPIDVFLHQLEDGSLVIFAFFMLSDPRSTPDHVLGRVFFALAVALVAYLIRFWFYSPRAILLSLFLLSPLTPILDSLFKHLRFEWDRPRSHNEKINFRGSGHLFLFPPTRVGFLRFLRR